MKTSITATLIAVIMVLSFSSFARENSNPLKVKEAKEILSTYVEATSIGDIKLNKFLFTNDFKYENKANNDIHGKKEYLKFLRTNKNLNYNCTTKSEITHETNELVIAKTTMQFENFTRVDHINLIPTKDGWKINKVTTSYI